MSPDEKTKRYEKRVQKRRIKRQKVRKKVFKIKECFSPRDHLRSSRTEVEHILFGTHFLSWFLIFILK